MAIFGRRRASSNPVSYPCLSRHPFLAPRAPRTLADDSTVAAINYEHFIRCDACRISGLSCQQISQCQSIERSGDRCPPGSYAYSDASRADTDKAYAAAQFDYVPSKCTWWQIRETWRVAEERQWWIYDRADVQISVAKCFPGPS